MVDPYAEVIRQLESEIRDLEHVIEVLRRRSAPAAGTEALPSRPPPLPHTPNGNGAGILTPASSVAVSVSTVLDRRSDVSPREIVEEAARLGKPDLNLNSVRWELADGLKAERYTRRLDEKKQTRYTKAPAKVEGAGRANVQLPLG